MNNSRVLIVMLTVFILFILLIVKLFDIQVTKHEELQYYANRQQTKVEKIKAERGLIYDRNGTLLVYNRNDVSFYLDLRMVSDEGEKKIAEKFSSIFKKSKNHYLNLMKEHGKTICIEEKAPSEQALQLKNFKVNGLFFRDDPTRIYQYDRLASHILGYVNSNLKGITGIENTFGDDLKGKDGTMLVERNAIGDMITIAEEQTKPAVPGNNIYLTIDKFYQSILEEELEKGLETYGGISATGIIMNPNDGEVLALANIGDYDPQSYWKFSDAERRNRAVTDSYEPGSTFKSITMAALLDQHLCKLNELINVEGGSYKFKNVPITDTHKHNYLSVKGVMEQSSNIGISKLVQRLDDDLFYKYVRAFGFGNYTSINLPGEVKGVLKKPNTWSAVTKSFMSFGYEISVTPIQLISAYSALINGGILYEPQLIKKEVESNNIVSFKNSPQEVRRVISEEVSKKMRNILASVVENGTGENAKLDFISVGGKTGTAQRLIDGSYSKLKYNSSFIGFFPVENPKIICLILVNAPEVGRYGGSVAAPIFKNTAERIVKSNFDFFLPHQENHDIKYVSTYEDNSNNQLKIIPAKNSFTNETNEKHISSLKVMPDLTGFSIREAITVLGKLGIKYKINGSGKISSQSIIPGKKISKNLMCILDCKEVSINGTVVY